MITCISISVLGLAIAALLGMGAGGGTFYEYEDEPSLKHMEELKKHKQYLSGDFSDE